MSMATPTTSDPSRRLSTVAARIGVGVTRRSAGPADRTTLAAALEQSFMAGLPQRTRRRLADRAVIALASPGAILYGPHHALRAVSVQVNGFTRAFMDDGRGRQLTLVYGGPGSPLSLSALAGGKEALIWVQALVPSTAIE